MVKIVYSLSTQQDKSTCFLCHRRIFRGKRAIFENSYKYCWTSTWIWKLSICINRFTRWPKAIPLCDISAETIATAFFSGWISRFGVPKEIVTDQGRQFESSLFNEVLKLLGIKRIRTTTYNPAANGLIERWHRTLKAALKCNFESNWVKALPTVLLNLRSTFKPELEASVAEMVYGATLRLPSEFF